MNLRSKNLKLYNATVPILNDEHPMTLRQLYYRAASAGLIAATAQEYQRLGRIMTAAREAGNVPRSFIVDHVRATLKPSSWTGLADFAEAVRDSYRKDFWSNLPHHVEILVEKDAVAGTIQPVTEQYDIRLRVCRGYASVSFAGEIADLWKRIKKPIYAFYCGDFDPSGFDIERDLRDKLERYSGRVCLEADCHDLTQFEIDESVFIWLRLGVREDDFEEFNLIELPVKKKDRRARGFMGTHGARCAEVDALPPSALRRRVEASIQEHIDQRRWKKLLATEATEKETLEKIVLDLGAA